MANGHKTYILNGNVSFTRPDNVRITDMCIFIDKNFPVLMEHPNQLLEDTIVRYLYFIIDSLAKKNKYFTTYKNYDEFSIFATSEIFAVLKKKWSRKGELVRGKEVQPIKSVLNYIKNVLYPYKVQFEQANYAFVTHDLPNADQMLENLREQVRQQYRVASDDVFEEVLTKLPDKVYKHLYKNTPYKTDPTMIKKIYMSCILTLIENMTLRNVIDRRLTKGEERVEKNRLFNAYCKNSQNVVLWHLPPHMENYIRYHVTKIKRIISNEFWAKRNPTDLSDEVVDSIMKTAFTTYDQDQEEL